MEEYAKNMNRSTLRLISIITVLITMAHLLLINPVHLPPTFVMCTYAISVGAFFKMWDIGKERIVHGIQCEKYQYGDGYRLEFNGNTYSWIGKTRVHTEPSTYITVDISYTKDDSEIVIMTDEHKIIRLNKVSKEI